MNNTCITEWLSLLNTKDMFKLVFKEYFKDKIGIHDFIEYYSSFMLSDFSDALEIEIAMFIFTYKHSYETIDGKLIWIYEKTLLEANKDLLFIFFDLFKLHINDKYNKKNTKTF